MSSEVPQIIKMEGEETMIVTVSDGTSEVSQELNLNNAKEVLEELSLTSVQFRDYLLIMNSDFDLIISEEPYHALTLLFDVRTWRYMARIWNCTVTTGNALSLKEFADVCRDHFSERRLCLGLLEDEAALENRGILITQTPLPRIMSKTCLRDIGRDAEGDVYSCSECLKLVAIKGDAVKDELGEAQEELAETKSEKSHRSVIFREGFFKLGCSFSPSKVPSDT